MSSVRTIADLLSDCYSRRERLANASREISDFIADLKQHSAKEGYSETKEKLENLRSEIDKLIRCYRNFKDMLLHALRNFCTCKKDVMACAADVYDVNNIDFVIEIGLSARFRDPEYHDWLLENALCTQNDPEDGETPVFTYVYLGALLSRGNMTLDEIVRKYNEEDYFEWTGIRTIQGALSGGYNNECAESFAEVVERAKKLEGKYKFNDLENIDLDLDKEIAVIATGRNFYSEASDLYYDFIES